MIKKTNNQVTAELYHDGFIQDAWEEFIYESDPRMLAEYLVRGGEITKEVKSAIIYIFKYKVKAEKQRGQNDWRDLAVYHQISFIMSFNVIGRKLCEMGVIDSEPLAELSLGQAIKIYIKNNHPGEEVSSQRIRAQYNRGKRKAEKGEGKNI